MILIDLRRRTLRTAFVLLAGLLLSPAAASDDYGHGFPAERGGAGSG